MLMDHEVLKLQELDSQYESELGDWKQNLRFRKQVGDKCFTVSHSCCQLFVYANCIYVLQMFFCFFFCFFRPQKNMRQPFSGTAEQIFMKLLPNDTGENVVCNVVPPPGECRAAAWRMANVDDVCNLRYDSGAITRGRHARPLRYKIMSARMDLI